MTSDMDPEYSKIPLQDQETYQSEGSRTDSDEGIEVKCPHCASQARDNRLLQKDQSLVIHVVCLFIILLSANLVLHGVFYNNASKFDVSEEASSTSWSTISLPTFMSSETMKQICLRYTSSFTPAFEAIEYYETDFENQFAHRTDYRGPPTEQLEEAWLDLWHHEGIIIQSWQMPMLNRTKLETYEKAKPEHGDGYIALLEVHHQLHCLNLVRQYTWLLMGSYPEDRIPPDLQQTPKANRMHVDHCIETLRLSLMCQGDMSPLLVTMDPSEPLGRKADFNTHHKCRNFDKLQEWTKAHGVEDWKSDGEPSHSHGKHQELGFSKSQ